ncbi:MAG: nitroreductase family protein [Leeuwenhoekiella sp.]
MAKTILEKTTPTDYDIVAEIKNRWSPRAFADTPISQSELMLLLEAGRWASSSYNRQPWRMIYGFKDKEVYDRIFKCLVPFNQDWAKTASALILGCYKKTTSEGQENFHALHDLGLFVGNMAIQAQHNGIAIHQMAGLDHEKAKKEFDFPDEYHVATAIAVGYYGGDVNSLPSELREDELQKIRKRKPISEFAFNGNFKK